MSPKPFRKCIHSIHSSEEATDTGAIVQLPLLDRAIARACFPHRQRGATSSTRLMTEMTQEKFPSSFNGRQAWHGMA